MLLFPFITCLLLNSDATAQVQQAWVARYNNGITNGTNQALKMALDSSGDIYVTGFSQNTNTNLGYVAIKYAPNGTQLWATRYDDTNFPAATPSGMVLDNSNHVIITGSALTVKYDPNGNQLWTAPYTGAALAVDTNGNIAVTGFDTMFSTVKMNAAGTNLWQETGPASCGAVEGQAIVADASGNFYVAGNYAWFCEHGIIDYELLLIKYGANGSQIWTATYGYGAQPPWQTEGVALQGGNLYIAGNFLGGGISQGYVVFEYDVTGSLLWSAFAANNGYSQDYSYVLDQSRMRADDRANSHGLSSGACVFLWNDEIGNERGNTLDQFVSSYCRCDKRGKCYCS